MPVAAPQSSVHSTNYAPSKATDTGQPCPSCGDGELKELDGWHYCPSCRCAWDEGEIEEMLDKNPAARDRRDILDCWNEDKKRGDRRSSGKCAVGTAKERPQVRDNYLQEEGPYYPDPMESKTKVLTVCNKSIRIEGLRSNASEVRRAVQNFIQECLDKTTSSVAESGCYTYGKRAPARDAGAFSVSVRLTDPEHLAVKVAAKELGVSVSALLRCIVQQYRERDAGIRL